MCGIEDIDKDNNKLGIALKGRCTERGSECAATGEGEQPVGVGGNPQWWGLGAGFGTPPHRRQRIPPLAAHVLPYPTTGPHSVTPTVNPTTTSPVGHSTTSYDAEDAPRCASSQGPCPPPHRKPRPAPGARGARKGKNLHEGGVI